VSPRPPSVGKVTTTQTTLSVPPVASVNVLRVIATLARPARSPILHGMASRPTPRTIQLAILGAVAVVYLSTTVFRVPVGHVGVAETFGVLRGPLGPGWHVKWPWPASQVIEVPTEAVAHLDVSGGGPAAVALAARPAGAGLAAPVAADLVEPRVAVAYRVSDPLAFARREDAVDRLGTLAEAAVAEALAADPAHAEHAARDRLQTEADAHGLGIAVVRVAVSTRPAVDTAAVVETGAARVAADAVVADARADARAARVAVAGQPAVSEALIADARKLHALRANRDALLGDPAYDERRAMEFAFAIRAVESQLDAGLELAGGRVAEMLAGAQADRWIAATDADARAEQVRGLRPAATRVPDLIRARLRADALADALAAKPAVVFRSGGAGLTPSEAAVSNPAPLPSGGAGGGSAANDVQPSTGSPPLDPSRSEGGVAFDLVNDRDAGVRPATAEGDLP